MKINDEFIFDNAGDKYPEGFPEKDFVSTLMKSGEYEELNSYLKTIQEYREKTKNSNFGEY